MYIKKPSKRRSSGLHDSKDCEAQAGQAIRSIELYRDLQSTLGDACPHIHSPESSASATHASKSFAASRASTASWRTVYGGGCEGGEGSLNKLLLYSLFYFISFLLLLLSLYLWCPNGGAWRRGREAPQAAESSAAAGGRPVINL